MASKEQNLSVYQANSVPDGEDMKVGIVVSEWNPKVTQALLKGCLETLAEHAVPEENITVVHVPGTYELSSGASLLFSNKNLQGVVCLGCVIKGDTRHDEYINSAVAHGLTHLSFKVNKPVIFGVLTTENMQQAIDRAGGKHGNKGVEAAVTVMKMIDLHKKIKETSGKIGF